MLEIRKTAIAIEEKELLQFKINLVSQSQGYEENIACRIRNQEA